MSTESWELQIRQYDIKEGRPWWRRRLVGLALMVVLLVLTTVAMLLLTYGVQLADVVARRMGLSPVFVIAWQMANGR